MEFKTRALTITVRPDDIVDIVPNEDWVEPDTMEIAKENVAAMKKAVDGKPRGLLSRTPSTYLSKEVMNYYSEAEVGEVATVILTNSFGSKVVGNLFLKLTGKSRGDAPIRIFSASNKEEGIAWLLEHINKAKKQAKRG
ncbi:MULTISPECIES: hypothetical protein [unclassified Aureispira]|uniref:hypothetical protein n=1 Tax=unclassified Aureispira TaxID=2649989 RepID=UPI000695D4D0|nr:MULTISPECIES: hypothetical protein [unclassified Aureispira]WMX12893.1 hypothetical protein QP953_18820 [Aureispira sp. CCB-E]